MTNHNNRQNVWMIAAFLMCFGAALSIGHAATDDRDRVLKYLDTVTVPKFFVKGEMRDEVIKKLNQALHKARPHTQIEIIFVPSPYYPSSKSDEARLAHSGYIDVDNCTVLQLMRVIGTMYAVDFKISGNKVVAVQGVYY